MLHEYRCHDDIIVKQGAQKTLRLSQSTIELYELLESGTGAVQ